MECVTNVPWFSLSLDSSQSSRPFFTESAFRMRRRVVRAGQRIFPSIHRDGEANVEALGILPTAHCTASYAFGGRVVQLQRILIFKCWCQLTSFRDGCTYVKMFFLIIFQDKSLFCPRGLYKDWPSLKNISFLYVKKDHCFKARFRPIFVSVWWLP